MVTQVGSQTFGIVVDGVFHTEEIVVKPMSTKLRHIAMFSGNTILGDGSVIMIIDPNGIAQTRRLRRARAPPSEAEEAQPGAARSRRPSRCWCSAPARSSPRRCRCRWSRGSKRSTARRSSSRTAAIWCSIAASSCRWSASTTRCACAREGAQPLLVFSDAGRSMGLVVDEIVDIVEDRLDIEVGSDTPGVLGSAVIKGQATEIIDIGHFLPLAFEDWFRRKEMSAEALTRTLLFVDDSAFFRNMLAPVLKAAGYDVTAVGAADEALALIKKGEQASTSIVSDIEMPGMNGFELAEAIRADRAHAQTCRSSRCPR